MAKIRIVVTNDEENDLAFLVQHAGFYSELATVYCGGVTELRSVFDVLLEILEKREKEYVAGELDKIRSNKRFPELVREAARKELENTNKPKDADAFTRAAESIEGLPRPIGGPFQNSPETYETY